MTREPDNGGGPVKPFLEHLEDLRRAILWSAAFLVAGMAAASAYAPAILRLLKFPLRRVVGDPDAFLRTFDVSGGMNAALLTMFWGGLILSSPAIVVIFGHFLFPALTRRERRAVLTWSGAAVLMFLAGVVTAFRYMLPVALKVMLWCSAWMGITVEFLTVASYVRFVLVLLLGFGLAFELPVVILALGYLGILSSRQLRSKRRHALVAILVFAMVLTPTTDPFSQLILTGPLILLYEICIWAIWARERRHNRGGIRNET
jgi:sec-independent protein translocase protein TatC